MIKHTAEPWDDELTPKVPKGSSQLLLNGKLKPPADCRVLSEPDFQRAKACVNACAGMHDPEMVIRMMKGIKVASSEVTTKGAIVTFDFEQAVETINSLTKQRYELVAALNKIIEMNLQNAEDKYGDKTRAETWSCVVVAKEAINKVKPTTNEH